MCDQSIEEAIFAACFAEPRDFSEEEKQYILSSTSESNDCNFNFRDSLLFWFESRLSNDCWTKANVAFIKAISTTAIEKRTKNNNLTSVQCVSFDSQQLATMLAALRHWQQSTRRTDRFTFPHFDDVEPLSDAEIDILCEEINCSKPLLTDNTVSSNYKALDGEWKLFERSVEDPVKGKQIEKLSLIEICTRHQDLSPFLQSLKQSESLNLTLEGDESSILNIKSLWNSYK